MFGHLRDGCGPCQSVAQTWKRGCGHDQQLRRAGVSLLRHLAFLLHHSKHETLKECVTFKASGVAEDNLMATHNHRFTNLDVSEVNSQRVLLPPSPLPFPSRAQRCHHASAYMTQAAGRSTSASWSQCRRSVITCVEGSMMRMGGGVGPSRVHAGRSSRASWSQCRRSVIICVEGSMMRMCGGVGPSRVHAGRSSSTSWSQCRRSVIICVEGSMMRMCGGVGPSRVHAGRSSSASWSWWLRAPRCCRPRTRPALDTCVCARVKRSPYTHAHGYVCVCVCMVYMVASCALSQRSIGLTRRMCVCVCVCVHAYLYPYVSII